MEETSKVRVNKENTQSSNTFYLLLAQNCLFVSPRWIKRKIYSQVASWNPKRFPAPSTSQPSLLELLKSTTYLLAPKVYSLSLPAYSSSVSPQPLRSLRLAPEAFPCTAPRCSWGGLPSCRS